MENSRFVGGKEKKQKTKSKKQKTTNFMYFNFIIKKSPGMFLLAVSEILHVFSVLFRYRSFCSILTFLVHKEGQDIP